MAGQVRDPQIRAGFRDVYLVALHGGVVAVVAMVRDFPGEVWRPKQGVQGLLATKQSRRRVQGRQSPDRQTRQVRKSTHETENIIDDPMIREGSVTALGSRGGAMR